MLSNAYIRNFLEINQNVRNIKLWHKRGHISCGLCRTGYRDDTHSEWNCFQHNTPQKIRDRLIDLNLCTACTMPSSIHNEGCSFTKILFCNRGDSCRRCGGIDHVFWTCDSTPHPGSQFEIVKKVNTTESNNDECTQHSAKELKHNCKKPEFLNENDPTKFVERDMKSNLKEKSLNKPQATNSSTESAPFYINDNLSKLENKFESILNKKLETVMLDMKSMHETISQKSAEIKTLKESVMSKHESKVEKCQNDNEAVLDQKTNNYLKELESKLVEKDNLIKTQKDELEKLNIEKANMSDQFSHHNFDWIHQISSLKETLATKDKSLKVKEKWNIEYQQEVEVLIGLLRRIFPKTQDMDPSLDNASVIKVLESLIEELESDKAELESDKAELKKITKDLSNEK